MTTKKRTTTKVYNQGSTRNTLFIIVFVGVIVLGAGFVLLNNQQPQAAASSSANSALLGQVQTFPILSRQHINPGDSHPPYNSNPPTNGWHFPVWADWGIYTQSIQDEFLVHNLEHGGIWISYRDANDSNTISQLQALISDDPDRMIMTLRPQDDTAIAVAAWGALLKLDKFDADTIKAFIQKYRYQGPENVPGNASG